MAAGVEDVAGQCGQMEAIERLTAAMSERVREDLLSLQWLVRGFLKACEVAEQWERLRELGCALGQGFLFARPPDAEASLAFVAAPAQ